MRTLAHEGTHQLNFNTGVLERLGDVPACILEGLAMYSEVRKLSGRTPPGGVNRERIESLARMQRTGVPWLPVERLLCDDVLLRAGPGPRILMAYSESWLLIDYLLKDPSLRVAFRRYLATIRSRSNRENRREDAQKHFSDLEDLDRSLRSYSVQLLKKTS